MASATARTATGITMSSKSRSRAPSIRQTGMIANLGELDPFVEREVIEPYDQKYLNEEVPEFCVQVPTTETCAAKSTGG